MGILIRSLLGAGVAFVLKGDHYLPVRQAEGVLFCISLLNERIKSAEILVSLRFRDTIYIQSIFVCWKKTEDPNEWMQQGMDQDHGRMGQPWIGASPMEITTTIRRL